MAAAELKLQVGLDLTFFRQQLAQLGSVAVGYQMPINIKFDRLGIQQELNRLATNINRRKYRLEIATNIKSETEAAQKLDAALDALKDKEISVKFTGTGDLSVEEARKIRAALGRSVLSNGGKIKIPATILAAITKDDITAFTRAAQAKLKEIALNVRADITSSADGLDTKEVRKIRVALRNAVLSNGGKIKIPATIQPSISNDEVASFRKLVQEKFKGITVTVGVEPQVSSKGAAAQASQGQPRGYETALESLKRLNPEQLRSRAMKSLGEESRTAQQVSNWVDILQADKGMGRGDKNKQLAAIRNVLAKALAESVGQGIEAKLQPLRGQKTMEAPRSASNINKILDPIANFTQNPGTARRMLRMLPESNISTNTLDVASRQARYYENTPSAREMQGKIKGFDPVMKAIAGDFANYTKGLSPSNPWVGNISRGIARMVSTAATSPQAQKLLPAAGQSSSSKMMRSAFAGLPPIQAPSIGQENAPLSRAATYSLNKARRILGMPIGPSSVYAPNPFAGAATVPPTAAVSGGFALPPAGTTSNYSATARRAAWAQVYQQSRPMQAPSVPPPMQPPGPPGPPNPPTPPGGGRGGFGSFGGLGGAMPNVSLPGAGLVKEVGDQFGYAAQQVLLFGTTYKALAFLTDFPSKVGEAVAQLQSFRNTLQAITPNADEFQKSNQFILDTVDKYNIPIQSARDGFTKLYASMEPAGFSGEQIQKLFLGISKASATLGLSSDKVDRVTYAFSQMASKGQLMSEEVTGQLGDVIPGALSIMAKAANMDIKTFKKAMEDGVFVGKAFTDVMSNVPIVLEQRFGKGAEGAAKTFQGQMNAMATATQMLYESFVPVGDLFTSKIVAPFTKGLQVLADGFNAFFSGAATKTAGGSALFQELEKLRPTFKGIADNIKQLLPVLQSFATTALGLGKILLQIAGNPFAGYLARVYLAVLPLTMAIQALNLQALVPMIASFVRAIPAFIAYQAALLQGVSANKSLQLSMALTGQSAGITAGKIRLIGAALGSLAVGGIVLGIGVLIERFMSLGAAIDGVHQATKQTVQGISSLANTGDVGGLKNILADTKKQVETFKGLRQFVGGGSLGAPSKQLTQPAANQMKALGLERFVSNDVFGKPYVNDFINASKLIEEKLKGLEKAAGAVQKKLPLAAKIAENIKQQAKKASDAITPITGAGGDEKKTNLESYYSLQDTLAKNAANFAAAQTEEDFRHRIELLERYYDIQETRANAYQKDAIRFEREMVMIEERRQEAKLKAQLDVQRAQSSVAGGVPGVAKLPGSISGRLDASGQNGADMPVGSNNAIQSYHNGIVKALGTAGKNGNYIVIDFIDDLGNRLEATYSHVAAAVKVGQSVVGGQAIGKFDASGRTTGPHNSIDINSLGNNGSLQRGRETSAARRSADILVAGGVQGQVPGSAGMAAAPVPASQKRDAVAVQSTLQASIAKTASDRRSDARAAQEQITAFEKYRAAAFPITEQDMQNKLLTKRNELFKSGMTDERIDQEVKLYENQERGAAGLAALDRLLTKKILTDTQYKALTKELNQDIANQNNLLQQNATLVGQSKFDQALKGVRDRLDMARALTPEAEMRTRLQQQGYAGTQLETLFETEKATAKAEELKTQMQGVASTIGDAFSTAFQGIINGSVSAQEALGNMFKSIGESFVKMAMDMIAKQLVMITLGFIMKALGLIGGIASAGNAAGAAAFSPGNAAGFDAIPGQAFSMPQLSGTMIDGSGFGAKAFAGPLAGGFAKGGAFSSGMRRFATGGIVNGPTLFPFADGGAMQMGLMGEAGPEAIMPLQRGADGSLGVRAAMGGNGMGGSSSPILNMSFETSTINGVEYVSRDQLEAAMMQTRRQASSDGAKRGMAMTLDKIQQSPQTRRRIGM